jgi:hypothetical protein
MGFDQNCFVTLFPGIIIEFVKQDCLADTP